MHFEIAGQANSRNGNSCGEDCEPLTSCGISKIRTSCSLNYLSPSLTAALFLSVFAVAGLCSEQLFAQADPPVDKPVADNTSESDTEQPAASADSKTPSDKPNMKKELPDADEEEDTVDLDLPPSFTRPVDLPPGATSDEEWIVKIGDGSSTALKRAKQEYNAVLNPGNGKFGSEAERDNFIQYLQWKLARFTLRSNLLNTENQDNIGKFRQELFSDLRKSARANEKFRDTFLELLVQETPKLFKYHHISRLNGAVILSELNAVEGQNVAGSRKAIPYLAAARPMLDLVKDQQQAGPVCVPAVRGLSRIIRDANPPDELTNEIVEAFVKELETSNPAFELYPSVLAQELGNIRIMNDKTGKPVVANVLTQVLADEKRPLRVRSEAAKALGRLPLDNSINVDLICYEIVKLEQDLVRAFEESAANAQQNGKKPNYKAWALNFWGPYVAFQGDSPQSIAREMACQTNRSVWDSKTRFVMHTIKCGHILVRS